MAKQVTSHLMMVRPAAFDFNTQTAKNNAFQDPEAKEIPAKITQADALSEFDDFVAKLREHQVHVTVIEDTLQPHKPDAVFPNNWVSFHEDGKVIMFPIFAENRRHERRIDIIEKLKAEYEVKEVIDLSGYESEGKFLESTGSMIFDRPNGIVYACYSPRTHEDVLSDFVKRFDVEVVAFTATDSEGREIYHTNVMMSIGDTFSVICAESIKSMTERENVLDSLKKTGKEVIEISLEQMGSFAGNMLAIENKLGEKLLVMSEQAFLSLNPEQIERLEKHVKLVHSPLYTIESNGGGSARCMMAEVFLPEVN
jgi:hypothetical protein